MHAACHHPADSASWPHAALLAPHQLHQHHGVRRHRQTGPRDRGPPNAGARTKHPTPATWLQAPSCQARAPADHIPYTRTSPAQESVGPPGASPATCQHAEGLKEARKTKPRVPRTGEPANFHSPATAPAEPLHPAPRLPSCTTSDLHTDTRKSEQEQEGQHHHRRATTAPAQRQHEDQRPVTQLPATRPESELSMHRERQVDQEGRGRDDSTRPVRES